MSVGQKEKAEKYAMEKGEQKGFITGQITEKQEVLLKLMNKKLKLTKKEEDIISNEFNPRNLYTPYETLSL
jgi:hypothetical protein